MLWITILLASLPAVAATASLQILGSGANILLGDTVIQQGPASNTINVDGSLTVQSQDILLMIQLLQLQVAQLMQTGIGQVRYENPLVPYTFTVPLNVTKIYITACGGGGGGAGYGGSGGGGGAAILDFPLPVTPGMNLTVQVGRAGATSIGAGVNGTASTVLAGGNMLLTVPGGSGGQSWAQIGPSYTVVPEGGSAGGAGGQPGLSGWGGGGGSSLYGQGGLTVTNATLLYGNDATGYCAGGGGSPQPGVPHHGGAGTNGLVVISW